MLRALSAVYLVWDTGPWDGATHIQRESSLICLEIPSHSCLEVCFLGDSKLQLTVKINHPGLL